MYYKNHWIPAFAGMTAGAFACPRQAGRHIQDFLAINDGED